jgi:predicted DNA-binding ribbon-helix-helix protein
MVRTQLYLTEEQYVALRQAARREGLSMSALLRRLIDQHIRGTTEKTNYSKDAIMAIVGLGVSGQTDISERHDEALAEFFRSDAGLDQEPDPSNASA